MWQIIFPDLRKKYDFLVNPIKLRRPLICFICSQVHYFMLGFSVHIKELFGGNLQSESFYARLCTSTHSPFSHPGKTGREYLRKERRNLVQPPYTRVLGQKRSVTSHPGGVTGKVLISGINIMGTQTKYN